MNLGKKIRIEAVVQFVTAFHIGSGRPGETTSDMGVLLDPAGKPILPGSSLKGVFRSTAEKRSEEHTSELQSHSFISYAVFCLKKKIPFLFFLLFFSPLI